VFRREKVNPPDRVALARRQGRLSTDPGNHGCLVSKKKKKEGNV